MTLPAGLILYEDVVDTKYGKTLYDYVDRLEWGTSLSRSVQHYGFTYDYNIKEPNAKILEKAPDPPHVVKCIADALFRNGILKNYPNQIIINKYLPGEGIGKHRDHSIIFGPDIATLSLGSQIVMTFEPYGKKNKGEKLDLVLKPGSLLVMRGESRYDWSHAIEKRKTDLINGKRVTRGTRISITFRHVLSKYIKDTPVENILKDIYQNIDLEEDLGPFEFDLLQFVDKGPKGENLATITLSMNNDAITVVYTPNGKFSFGTIKDQNILVQAWAPFKTKTSLSRANLTTLIEKILELSHKHKIQITKRNIILGTIHNGKYIK